MVDQRTFELVRDMVMKSTKYPIDEFLAVDSLAIVSGSLKLDESTIEALPSKTEETILSAVNCTGDTRKWVKDQVIKTTRSFTFSATKSITTTTTSKIGIDFGANGLKFNSDLTTDNSVQLGSSISQTYTTEVTENIHREEPIKPNTVLYIKFNVVKGVLKGRVSGAVIVDGWVTVRRGTFVLHVALNDVGQFNTEPQYRTVEMDSYIYAEGYEKTDIVFKERPLPTDDPLCQFGLARNVIGSPNNKMSGVVEYAGSLSRAREIALWSLNDKVKCVLRNNDFEDLFVWAWDMNTFGSEPILSGVRLNDGDTLLIELVASGAGRGRVRWRAMLASDPAKYREDERTVSSGDYVEIETRLV